MKPMQANAVLEPAAEVSGCMNDMAEGFRSRAQALQQEATRNFRRAKAKAEDLLEESRHEIKTHPLAAVAGFTLAGAALGFVAGVFVGRKRGS